MGVLSRADESSSLAEVFGDRMMNVEDVKLNQRLVEMHGLSENTQTAIKVVMVKLYGVLEEPSTCSKDMRVVVRVIEGLEFTLQMLWGFDRNSDYHRYWHRVKGCTCPSMDNNDPLYHGHRIITQGCPFHDPAGVTHEA